MYYRETNAGWKSIVKKESDKQAKWPPASNEKLTCRSESAGEKHKE
jgi:hypothetical protein